MRGLCRKVLYMEKTKQLSRQPHAAIDVMKLIMAFLVVAIHTEPFGFSFWLDKGFGIVTRLCVPFFFVASSYFFFLKNGSALRYVKRLFLLYLIWSIIYLPFDIAELKTMSIPDILLRYFWIGNGHALWYLCGSILGFGIVYLLSRVLNHKVVFGISLVFLVIGTLKSTYAPMLESFSVPVSDVLGSRNGLFYAFPYYALGLMIAKTDTSFEKPQMKHLIGFILSMCVLVAESLVFVYLYKTEKTVLWLSVLPLTYNFFMIVKNIKCPISHETSVVCRKLSTVIYVTHCFYMYLLPSLDYWKLFLVVALISATVGLLLVLLSKKRGFKWLAYLF